MGTKKPSLVPGVFFIWIGLWYLARRIFIFTDYWNLITPFFLVGFGLFLFIETLRRNQTNTLFWGVVFSLIGVFFVMRNFGIIPFYYSDEYWPIFLLAIGLAFFAQFIMKPADWGVLIPSIIFLTIGVGFSLHTFQYSFLGVRLFFNTYWPLLLILIGIIVILGGLKEKSKHKNNT